MRGRPITTSTDICPHQPCRLQWPSIVHTKPKIKYVLVRDSCDAGKWPCIKLIQNHTNVVLITMYVHVHN